MSLNGQAMIVGRFDMRVGMRFDAHDHPVHQLAWSEQGILAVTIDEQTWVLPSTRALFIPAKRVHTTYATSPATMTSAYFSRRVFPKKWTDPTVVAMPPLARELVRFLAGDPKGASRKHAQQLLFTCLTPLSAASIGVPLPRDPRALRVTEALLANAGDPRELAAFGKAAGASARTLARLFVDETGMTFGEWRMRARIQSALVALASGEPVARVAEAVGYETASAFIAAFRRQTGTSPRAYFASQTV